MSTDPVVRLTRLEPTVVTVRIVGTAPLIVHAWDAKAKTMMLAAQQGKKAPKAPKDPDADFRASQYRFPDGGHGFPALAFKSATVTGGARAFGKSVKMTELRQHLVFQPDGMSTAGGLPLTRLITDEPTMREDTVRVGRGIADLRYRAQYTDWAADLVIAFSPHIIDLGSVVALVDAGGANGIGEWRPEKDGAFGTYRVESGA